MNECWNGCKLASSIADEVRIFVFAVFASFCFFRAVAFAVFAGFGTFCGLQLVFNQYK